jgi:hypothetical protein
VPGAWLSFMSLFRRGGHLSNHIMNTTFAITEYAVVTFLCVHTAVVIPEQQLILAAVSESKNCEQTHVHWGVPAPQRTSVTAHSEERTSTTASLY